MKYYITLLLIVCFVSASTAKPVDETMARSAAENFIGSIGRQTDKMQSGLSLELVYKSSSLAGMLAGPDQSPVEIKSRSIDKNLNEKSAVNYYYIFNFRQSNGFIIIAADDQVPPVLGYSLESRFNTVNISPAVAKWLDGYQLQIRYVIDNSIPAGESIERKWNSLNKKNSDALLNNQSAVNPLMTTKWDQSPYYNDQCPFDNDYNDRTVTGCVATAMAQIMKYWSYPENGSGFHSYNHAKFGAQSANFGNSAYNWNNMPDQITGANADVASLIYQVGVSVDMNYGVGSQGGSTAFVISSHAPQGMSCSEVALKTYFGYKETLQGLQRFNFSDAAWLGMMKKELDESRPVLYVGYGNGGGHCFVCDGYDNNDYFHFNWGWSGSYDGYFLIDALNPGGVGTGGGEGGYNNYQQAVIGIEPPQKAPKSFNLQLYDYITPSATTILYGSEFSVTTNIVNSGTGEFSGDYSAAMFNDKKEFVDFVEVLKGYSLQPGNRYQENLVFTSKSNFTILPGRYYIGIFYKADNANWVRVNDNGEMTNFIMVEVVNPNDIKLYSKITVTSGETIIQGKPLTVNLDIINASAEDFAGSVNLSLYKPDGAFVAEIQQADNLELPVGYHFTDGLDFSSQGLDVPPGTYLLAAAHKRDNGPWELTGSDNEYQNPVLVVVREAGLQPDKYENDDKVDVAANLNVDFNGNTSLVTTEGSNCHTGSDYDYYKVQLEPGYDYTIKAKMFDANKDENAWSLDAIYSYSFDGINWSDAYIGDLPDDIRVHGGGTVYFFISPFFIGETGTYRLELNITKSTLGVDQTAEAGEMFTVWPNPVSSLVNIDLTEQSPSVRRVELLNSLGQSVYSAETDKSVGKILLPVGNISDGMYILNLYTDMGIVSKKIIVKR